uniref:Putative oxidoreductase domain-containing protein n=1 Tax=uncultured bacterium Ad_113_I18_contig2 TaxID=1489298 RepID=A0A0B4N0W0_9BACT|nr:putative oxidoreductase domain-containing protein [uncultured bacterium Ad_113_I18_contig2]
MIRQAIIGFGGMGSWHARNVKSRVPGIEVYGAYDVRPEAAEAARAQGLHVYDSLESLLRDESVQLVTIAVPNNFHKDLSIAALRAGKNVVCEKPVTLNAWELEEIIAVRDETGKVFSVHQNRRWDKDYRIVKAAKDQGLLGRVYMVESKVQGSRGTMFGWRGHKENGGGMLLDWGVHLLDQAMQMFDEKVVSVDAHLLSMYTPGVDDNIKLFIRFAGGCSYLLEMTTNCLINGPRWHVQGTEGTLQIEDWSCKGRLLKLKPNAEMKWSDDIVYTEAGPTRTMAPRPEYTMNELPLPDENPDWTEYYKNILSAMEGKEDLLVKPEQALRVMRVIDLMFKAEREGVGQQCEI